MESSGPGLGDGSGARACHGYLPHHRPTEQDPIRGEDFVASFSKGTRCSLSARLHFEVHSRTDICLYFLSPIPILLRRPRDDLGALHVALTRKRARWSQKCHHLTPLPYANGRLAEPASPSGHPKEAFWTT